jgi:RNA polymerase sigma-70 factor (ECF subfamily)
MHATSVEPGVEPGLVHPSLLDRGLLDRQLLGRLVARDEAALGELHDRYAPALEALALRILRDAAAAEEVVQEVFLHAWRRAGSYDPRRSSVSTWLVLVTRSRAIDHLRSRRVVERTHDHVRHLAPLHEPPAGARRVHEGERRRRIRAELARLPAEQRQVLELAYYRDLTQSEIAASTGIPLGTVKTRTLLAMRKLRGALEAEREELAG